MILPLALLLAVFPSILISWFIYSRDKHAPEPHRHLILCFLFGALSTIPAIFLEAFGSAYAVPSPDIFITFFYALVIIAGSEELVKFISLKIYIYNQNDFDEPLDGIVYAMMVGMGFATVENILYVLSSGIEVAILRMFTAVPAHAAFAVLMGYFMGLARFEKDASKRLYLLLLSYAAPTLSHGLYDFFLFQQNFEALVFLAFAVLILSIILSFHLLKKHTDESANRHLNKDEKPTDDIFDSFDDFN